MPRRPNRYPDARKLFLLISLLIAALILTSLRWGAGWQWLWSYLVAVNITTAILYAVDKRSAAAGGLRVPERTLHGWAFAGGTPAAYASQQFWRHKTLKGSFRAWFWGIFALQVALLVAWFVFAKA